MSLWLIVSGHCCGVAAGQIHAVRVLSRPHKSRRKTYDAACGRRAAILGFPVQGKPDDAMSVAWPPYVDDAREWGYERCRDCMTAAPGKPRRPPFVKGEAA